MDEILRSDPEKLIHLMGEPGGCGKWSRADLCAMLQHQLAAPLLPDLGPGALSCGLDAQTISAMRFGELLNYPDPPRELLRLAKEFSKSCDGRVESPLPSELASVIYCSVLAAAELTKDQAITDLSPAQVQAALEWASTREWLVPEILQLLERGIAKLRERIAVFQSSKQCNSDDPPNSKR